MRIIITRHGETYANISKIMCGWYNSKLTQVGENQAEKLASRLAGEKIDVVFCSDLTRCKQTLKPYLQKRKIKVIYTKMLREQGYGVFEGKPSSECIEWFKDNPGKEPKGWESKEQLRERVSEFITKKLSKFVNKNVLIITHGRTKKMILEVLLANSKVDQEMIKKDIPNTGVTIINLSDRDNPIIEILNSDKHLNPSDD